MLLAASVQLTGIKLSQFCNEIQKRHLNVDTCFEFDFLICVFSDIDTPFAKWNTDQVVSWLHAMGLGQYAAMCRIWVKNGSTLLKATPIELERVSTYQLEFFFVLFCIFFLQSFVTLTQVEYRPASRFLVT